MKKRTGCVIESPVFTGLMSLFLTLNGLAGQTGGFQVQSPIMTPPPKTSVPPERFILLDFLRGLAAFSVVLFHWKHFMFAPGAESASAAMLQSQPFYDTLRVIYEQGFRAVDLFFCLSGFIFYRLYAQTIANGPMDAKRFFVLRFSRLYPLHFATLCLVVLLQGLYVAQTGLMFVYQHNDLGHFVMQLLFMQNWGLESGDSFNGPSWSVSVEVLVYLVFFVLCQRGLAGWRTAAGMVVLGLLFYKFNPMVARGLMGFFMGGIVALLYAAAQQASQQTRRRLLGLSLLVVLPGYAMVFASPDAWLTQAIVDPIASAAGGKGRFLLSSLTVLVLFPLTVLALALLEPIYGRDFASLAWFGNITYSSYLLHFPLQLAIVLIAGAAGWHFDATSAWALAGYCVVLTVLSLWVYARFELPMQKELRENLFAPRLGGKLSRPVLPNARSSRLRRKSRAAP